MTKTKLVGGIMAMGFVAGAVMGVAAPNSSQQAYAKSVPTATDGLTEPTATNVGLVPAQQEATVKRLPTLLRVNSADDERGFEKSAYKGKYFHRADETLRRCIITRESHATYMLNGGGAYQFMSYDRWPISLSWMLKKEIRKHYGKRLANKMQKILSHHEVNEWSRYWQDAAFYTVLNYKGRHSGIKHWTATVPGTDCF